MLLSLSACGKNAESKTTIDTNTGNEISQLLKEGYIEGFGKLEDGVYSVLLSSPDRTDFLQASLPMTDEEYAKLVELDFFADDYNEQVIELYAALPGEVTVTSMNDQVPSREELDKLIGKSLTELEEMGYDQTAIDSDADDNLVLIYSIDNLDIAIGLGEEYPDLFTLLDADPSMVTAVSAYFYEFR